ncbi:hypothetical protein F4810DRAFT_331617 [Camillea tinctor]|nr:hypothetical protein F4810DRAFT_331617 [Camillea tinctor]
MCGIIVLEVINSIFLKHNGLGSVNGGISYLWTLGPTSGSVLTVVLAFWTGVEYQACRYAPWIILGRGQGHMQTNHWHHDSSRTVLLDYSSMWLPKAIIAAVKNRHFMVLSTIFTSILLRIQIVLIPGLFSTSQVTFHNSIELIDLLDEFYHQTPEPNVLLSDSRPYMARRALRNFGIPYPNFTLPGVALQKFDVEKTLPTADNVTELGIVVDGVEIQMDCESPNATVSQLIGELGQNQIDYEVPSSLLHSTLNYSLPTGRCVNDNGYYLTYYWENQVDSTGAWKSYFASTVIS